MTATFPGSVKSFGADRVAGDYIPASDTNDLRDEVVAIETALLGGWLAQLETWNYASASTFTVAGDRTAYYTKGRKVKWTQTTVKYGIISGSTYSSPNTTVTILVNTDYVITNAAISANAVSDLVNPQGWPGAFTYTPTGVSASNVTLTGRYAIVGKICHVDFAASFTGAITFTSMPTLPVPIASTYKSISIGVGGLASYYDASGPTYAYMSLITILYPSGTTITIASGAGLPLSASYPVTWANGDKLEAHFCYEW